MMTEAEVKRIAAEAAAEAAERAVEAVLARLGIEADEARDMQADMLHLRRWRLTTEAVQRQGFLTMTIMFVTGLLGLVWLSIRGGH